jgi:type IV secretory pathway VirB6-like protein
VKIIILRAEPKAKKASGALLAYPFVKEGKTLTIIEIIDTFTFYGIDVILLAAATCIIVQVIKATLLKNCKKKIITFLPFFIGCVLYAVYAGLYNLSFVYLLENFTLILEHGFGVGALSTVMYVWYEQFIREKSTCSQTVGVISTLIEGYVPSDKLEATAQKIADAIQKDVTGDGANKAAEILSEDLEEGITERDVALLSKLIIETLAHLNAE